MGESFYHTENISRRFFSLVEMLVVMVIIAILVGIGAGGYTVAQRWMAQSRTEALLAKLKVALEAYKNDKGYYPLPHTDPTETNHSNVPNFRLDVNVNDFTGSVPSPNDHLQPRNNMSSFLDYSELRHEQSFKREHSNYIEYFVKDGWKTPAGSEEYGAIKYRCPGAVNTTSFDIYS
ncbi:MAG: type II secretion system protein, partial [Victivallaceae bacterium]|nr:type II secretion system protein [Victivallaceae bacterium]